MFVFLLMRKNRKAFGMRTFSFRETQKTPNHRYSKNLLLCVLKIGVVYFDGLQKWGSKRVSFWKKVFVHILIYSSKSCVEIAYFFCFRI